MIGAILGDIIGSTHEYKDRIKTKEFNIFPEGSTFTDDSVLTLAVAESLITDIPYEESFYKWVSKYPNRGYGQQFFQWIISKDKHPYQSKGNGAAMRVSPIAWYYDTEEAVLSEAKRCAEITHDTKEGVESSQAVAMAILMAKQKQTKDEIKKYITKNFGYDLERKLDDIRTDYKHSMLAVESVPESIICFLESDSFLDAVRNAVSLGGDADTMASISGAIAEAMYGIPEDLIYQFKAYTKPYIPNISFYLQGILQSSHPSLGVF